MTPIGGAVKSYLNHIFSLKKDYSDETVWVIAMAPNGTQALGIAILITIFSGSSFGFDLSAQMVFPVPSTSKRNKDKQRPSLF